MLNGEQMLQDDGMKARKVKETKSREGKARTEKSIKEKEGEGALEG